jgi:hypothetical protein
MSVVAALVFLAVLLLWHWTFGGARVLRGLRSFLLRNRIDPM